LMDAQTVEAPSAGWLRRSYCRGPRLRRIVPSCPTPKRRDECQTGRNQLLLAVTGKATAYKSGRSRTRRSLTTWTYGLSKVGGT
ncbi:MAG: hypothetical protein ACKOEW_02320, partial [Methylocystis sp.]